MNLELIHFDDRSFVNDRLSGFPAAFKKHILSGYLKDLAKKSRREANLALIDVTDAADSVITHRLNRSNLNSDENALKALAELKANHSGVLLRLISSESKEIAYKQILSFIKRHGIEPSFIKEIPDSSDMDALLKRSRNPSWWLRQLRKVQNRDIEITARHLNLVSSKSQPYVSDLNHQRHQQQKIEQRSFLENMLAENEDGDAFFLSELHDLSISNPNIKHAEMMVRCRGFENIAKGLGHESMFITITCPSKYHRAFGKGGEPNPKYNGAKVTDCQKYLQDIWAKIRSSLDRQGIRVYGFRVAEPHHDGTPHWHMLLFLEPKNIEALNDTFFSYCLAEDGDEKGALENRVKFIKIDPKKGSATGYIAKYIAKNINGENLESSTDGENPSITAQRIVAWASVWGIRQFQQIGGAPVSPYRELRRMDKQEDKDSILEHARIAADNADWEGYQNAMGGIDCARVDRPIEIVYWTEVDAYTGEIESNQYGELKTPRIFGLEFEGKTFNTRPHLWKISRACS